MKLKQLLEMLKELDENSIIYRSTEIDNLLTSENSDEEQIANHMKQFKNIIIRTCDDDELISNHLISEINNEKTLIMF